MSPIPSSWRTFIGESNIYDRQDEQVIRRVHFCGADFDCLDDLPDRGQGRCDRPAGGRHYDRTGAGNDHRRGATP